MFPSDITRGFFFTFSRKTQAHLEKFKRSNHADVATISEMTFRSPFGKPRQGGRSFRYRIHYGPVPVVPFFSTVQVKFDSGN